jgi:hypothetical protein
VGHFINEKFNFFINNSIEKKKNNKAQIDFERVKRDYPIGCLAIRLKTIEFSNDQIDC